MTGPILSPGDPLLLAQYEKDGRGPDRFDCFGLARVLFARQGIEVPDQPGPEKLDERENAIAVEIAWHWEQLDGPIPGAGVLIRTAGFGAHLGVVLDDGEHFIHMTRAGVCIARVDDDRWARRILGYYRHA